MHLNEVLAIRTPTVMKRVIDGVTYDTNTSTRVATAEVLEEEFRGRPEERRKYVLYKTRGGAFFVHVHTETSRQNMRGDWEAVESHVFEPMTYDEAHEWVMSGQVELLDEDAIASPPEAVAEAETAATVYLRMPTSLKVRVEKLASEEGLSLNAWYTRCGERCADMWKVGERLGEIISTGLAYNTGIFSDTGMIEHMHKQAEAAAKLLGWHGKELENLSNDVSGYADHRVWEALDDASTSTEDQPAQQGEPASHPKASPPLSPRERNERRMEALGEVASRLWSDEEQRNASRERGLTQTVEAVKRRARRGANKP
jgi:hypothetical protein